MFFSFAILAYLGPETVLPVTSVIAGAIGVIMLLGKTWLRRGMQAARRLVALFRPGPEPRVRPRRKIGTGPVNGVKRRASNRTEA